MDEKPEEKPDDKPVIDNVKHFGIICEPGTMGLIMSEGEQPNGSVQQVQ